MRIVTQPDDTSWRTEQVTALKAIVVPFGDLEWKAESGIVLKDNSQPAPLREIQKE